MARKLRGQPLNGWVILDKPEGITSSKAVGAVRRALDARKAGHGGTLDPLATGVLPIALGEATKALPYVVDRDKAYLFTACWGEERETDDREGKVTQSGGHHPTKSDILGILPQFVGEIEQTPPAYSAIKVAGERAYKLARAGETVDLAPRRVLIQSFDLLSPDSGEDEASGLEQAEFEIVCGKGTYVRALVRDLARALGTFGYLGKLRRTRVGHFTESRAISLDMLDELVHSAPLSECLLPLETALDDIPALAVTASEAARLKSGQVVRTPSTKQGVVFVTADGQPVAMARVEDGAVHPVRVFNL